MHKRLALLATMVMLGAALAMPGTAAAGSSYQWQVKKNTCNNKKGAYGYGKAKLNVRMYEWYTSGTAQFRYKVVAQYRIGSKWKKAKGSGWIYSNYFGNTSASKYYNTKYTFHWGSLHYSNYARLKWVGQWLKPNGKPVAKQTLFGKAC